MALTEKALRIVRGANYAAQIHVGQRRKGVAAEPYINHLLEVATLVADAGADTEVVLAALLHDSVEDTDVSEDLLTHLWGRRVSSLVMELTDDKSLPKEERKRLQVLDAPKKSPEAQLIKLADKISNLRGIATSPPAGWSDQRKLEYCSWSEQVVARLTEPNALLLKIFHETVLAFRQSQDSGGR